MPFYRTYSYVEVDQTEEAKSQAWVLWQLTKHKDKDDLDSVRKYLKVWDRLDYIHAMV